LQVEYLSTSRFNFSSAIALRKYAFTKVLSRAIAWLASSLADAKSSNDNLAAALSTKHKHTQKYYTYICSQLGVKTAYQAYLLVRSTGVGPYFSIASEYKILAFSNSFLTKCSFASDLISSAEAIPVYQWQCE